ncbi:hypothetical protein QN219_18450 [Sinorhizobium sp. 7-81]|uniref:hypothetical protein n=1 Tax=Sinorhizobium sp. 8-89 TaxID=3049089 RepID=UPI0024C410C8|nr:hypothetical protein [Sinorhizobium sp. 8-89]MDK1492024.1 hypothetical protein [Sinorhizobium sp. 8-89]
MADAANDRPHFPTATSPLFGLGLADFLDGIVLHQLLRGCRLLTSGVHPLAAWKLRPLLLQHRNPGLRVIHRLNLT